MHELSIATSLVTVAAEAVAEAGETRRIEAVRVRIGDLAGVVIEALHFAWDVAIEGTACAGATLEIERVPGRIHCDDCGATTILDQPPRFRCGTCDRPTGNVVGGRELDLTALELADDHDPVVSLPPEAPHAAAHP